jgi:curved DNA-binding protein CbpA
MKGRLKDRSVGALLDSLHTREASGVLTVEKKPARRQFCLLKGIVRLAASNVPEERFGEFLASYEALDREIILAAERECATNGKRLGEVLMASGAIGLDTLRGWVRYYTLEMIFLSETWTDGEYRFAEGVPNIIGEVTVEVPPLEIALERHRRSIPEAPMKQLTSNQPLIVTPSPARNGELRRLRMTGAESFVMQRLKGATDLQAILKDSPFEEIDTLRAVAVLTASGIVDLSARRSQTGYRPSGSRAGGAAAGPVAAGGSSTAYGSRAAGHADGEDETVSIEYYDRMHSLLMGADFYRTLGLETDATNDQIREAYYRLAREIHPDRFLTSPMDVLHAKMEELFSQVLDAYRTLTDSESRGRYDAQLLVGGTTQKVAAAEQREVARQNFLRGRALVEMGKPAEAVTFLQNAVDLDPGRGEYWRVLAQIQAGNPRMRREAEMNYIRAIALEPANAENYLRLGLVYRRLGEIDRAIERLNESLKWDPSLEEAKLALQEIESGARPEPPPPPASGTTGPA